MKFNETDVREMLFQNGLDYYNLIRLFQTMKISRDFMREIIEHTQQNELLVLESEMIDFMMSDRDFSEKELQNFNLFLEERVENLEECDSLWLSIRNRFKEKLQDVINNRQSEELIFKW